MKISFFFAWYDLYVGAYWSRSRRALYIVPFPTLGLKLQLKPRAFDVHRLRAAHALGIPATDVTAAQRAVAKRLNFCGAYGRNPDPIRSE